MALSQSTASALLLCALACFCGGATARYIQPDPIGLEGGPNVYVYVANDPLTQIDPLGLANGPAVGWMNLGGRQPGWYPTPGTPSPVFICGRPVNISWLPSGAPQYLPQHMWVKTPNGEAGMGGECPIPGQQCSDVPYSSTQVVSHRGQSTYPGASCKQQDDVDVDCVNRLIALGTQTGRWSIINNCQTFAVDVVNACRRRR